MLEQDVIESFNGINTKADPLNENYSVLLYNWDINTGGDLEKTKGYSKTTSTTMAVTGISKASNAVITVSSTASLSNNDLVVFYGFTETGTTTATYNQLLNEKICKITKIDGTTFSVDIDTQTVTTTFSSCTIDLSLKSLGNTFLSNSSDNVSLIKNFGSYCKNDTAYAFIGTDSSNYLCKTNLTSIDWEFAEDTPTEFTTTDIAEFVEYEGNIIFTKNTKLTINSSDGGVLYIDGTTMRLFGVSNNPTGKHLEVHNERLWVGDISYQGSSAVTGGSWVIPSKLFPEATDTEKTITAISVGSTTTISSTGHGFVVGDAVYFTDIVGTAGTQLLNGNMFYVVGSESNKFTIDVNSTGLAYTSGGKAVLRGNTWGIGLFDNGTDGSGVFKCDNNLTDSVMFLKFGFGNLIIGRKESIYFFTGSIETSTVTLARRFNVPYGAVSSSTSTSAGGIYFISPYGLSKIDATTVSSVQTSFDNIVTVTVSDPIETLLALSGDNSNLKVYTFGRYIWVYDDTEKTVYQFDTLIGKWSVHTNKCLDFLYLYNYETYFIWKYSVFKVNEGYYTYSTPYSMTPISSVWKSNIRIQGSYNYQKDYRDIYLLMYTKDNPTAFDLPIELYYGFGSNNPQLLSVSIPANTSKTWSEVTNNGLDTWGTVTSNGGVTWETVTGSGVDDISRHKYYLKVGKSIQIKITHNYPYAFKINRIILGYEQLGIRKVD